MNQHSFLSRVYHSAGLISKASDEVIKLGFSHEQLTPEDEVTFSVVTKAKIDQLRRAHRIVQIINEREDKKGKVNRVIILRGFRAKIEEELASLLSQYISLINNVFLNDPSNENSKILFLKMKADYLRYLAEIQRTQIQIVQDAYAQAYKAAKSLLNPAHPLRTGIVLNYSVFYFEIVGNKLSAKEIAKLGYEEAIAAIKTLPSDEREDTMEILNLISANLKNWEKSP